MGDLFMKKNIIKIGLMILGNGILVAGIIESIDGVGRFAMILFGVLFSIIGGCLSFNKKEK